MYFFNITVVRGLYWVAAERSGCTDKWMWCIRGETAVEAALVTKAQSDVKRKGCLLWDGTFSDEYCRSSNQFICEVNFNVAL
jgi:hypothetical protein